MSFIVHKVGQVPVPTTLTFPQKKGESTDVAGLVTVNSRFSYGKVGD